MMISNTGNTKIAPKCHC